MKKIGKTLVIILTVLFGIALSIMAVALPVWLETQTAMKEQAKTLAAVQEFTVEGRLLAVIQYDQKNIQTKGELKENYIDLINEQNPFWPFWGDAGEKLLTYSYIIGEPSSSKQEICLAKQNLEPMPNSIIIFLSAPDDQVNCYRITDYWPSGLPSVMSNFTKPDMPLNKTFESLTIGSTVKIPSTILLTGGQRISNRLLFFNNEPIPHLTS